MNIVKNKESRNAKIEDQKIEGTQKIKDTQRPSIVEVKKSKNVKLEEKPEDKKEKIGKEEKAEPSVRCMRDAKPDTMCRVDTSQQGYPTGAEMPKTVNEKGGEEHECPAQSLRRMLVAGTTGTDSRQRALRLHPMQKQNMMITMRLLQENYSTQ